MAEKSSGNLTHGKSYNLGKYVFICTEEDVSGSYSKKYTARCTCEGKSAYKTIIIPGDSDYWYLEANETEASVYTITKAKTTNIPTHSGGGTVTFVDGAYNVDYLNGSVKSFTASGQNYWVSASPFTMVINNFDNQGRATSSETHTASATTIRGKPVYMLSWAKAANVASDYKPVYSGTVTNDDLYCLVYGSIPSEIKLVGRFAIDLEDAGGVGPGSDWVDPGDYDPDWEPEDPTHTLYVEVTGALSGRHNDPIVDPSYSYIPAVKDTVKQYGCGGDGGHGGGGGAGASTVVIHKFATNQANSKEVTAIARRHGYGSGGGKGGKGGDGCILVYY